ncbi:MAG: hypothetical protein M1531_08070 [Chloroflexi bacterium]|nr:hypothetical protein [Chloroflexota bacterium]
MRYTIIDRSGAVSFVADCAALNRIVAACAANPPDLPHFLSEVAYLEPQLAEYVESGLAVFDEHNLPEKHDSIHQAIAYCRPHELPVFRVVDDVTRQASLQPVKAGVVIFNLLAHRIVQIQNTYAEIRRQGRFLVRVPERRVHRYELPADWALVP